MTDNTIDSAAVDAALTDMIGLGSVTITFRYYPPTRSKLGHYTANQAEGSTPIVALMELVRLEQEARNAGA